MSAGYSFEIPKILQIEFACLVYPDIGMVTLKREIQIIGESVTVRRKRVVTLYDGISRWMPYNEQIREFSACCYKAMVE